MNHEIPTWLGKHGLQDHHALNEAKANRYAYDPARVRADLNTFIGVRCGQKL